LDYKVKLWGKKDPFKPLIYHLIDAGNVCRALIDTPSFSNIVGKLSKKMDCEEKKLIPWLQFIVSLHDIGKCHPDFQGKAEFFFVKELKERGLIANKPYKAYRHEGFGSDWILNLLQSKYGWGKKPARTIRMELKFLQICDG